MSDSYQIIGCLHSAVRYSYIAFEAQSLGPQQRLIRKTFRHFSNKRLPCQEAIRTILQKTSLDCFNLIK